MNDTQHDSHVHEQAEVLYDQVLDLFDQERYVECLALLGQVLPLERDNAHIYYSRGNTRYMLKDFRGAAAEYLWALRCAPYYVEAYNNLGNTYEALAQYEKSIAQYQHALAIEPESATVHYNLGGVYISLGKLSEALDALSRAIELEPDFSWAYGNRGHVRSRLGLHTEAFYDYAQAFRLTPDDPDTAWTHLWAQFGKDSLSEAGIQELERISCLDPEHYTSQMCLAVIALSRGAMQESLVHLEQAVTAEPKQWDPHFWTGLVAAMAGETEVARQAIEHALELGLPPVLLTPLFWLKDTHPDFFGQYVYGLLQRFNV